jgi:hypothetical protein
MAGIDSYVKLYSSFDSAIQDDWGGKTLTGNGSASISTSVKKFGAGSLEFSSATSDFVSISDDSDFDLGSGDFTIDLQARFKTLPTSGNSMCLFSQSAAITTDKAYGLYVQNIGGSYYLTFEYTTDGSTVKTQNIEISISTDTWYHIALTRESTICNLFFGGNHVGTVYVGSDTFYNSSATFKIGATYSTAEKFLDGYIDEFRLSKGIARYTLKVFDVPTSEYTEDSNDKILLHMDGDNGSTSFKNNGTSRYKANLGNGASYFNGGTDYADCPDHSSFDFGSGDWTIDFWIRRTSASDNNNILNKIGTYSVVLRYKGIKFYYSTDGSSYANYQFTTNSIPFDTWTHVALVRNSTTVTCYINGVADTNTFNVGTSTFYTSTSAFSLTSSNASLIGYLDEVRISKGIKRWTSNFTPPSTEYSDDAYTSLLMHMNADTDGSTDFIDSSSNSHSFTAYSNAQIRRYDALVVLPNENAVQSTTSPKIGTAKALCSAENDYLYSPDNDDYDLGSDDFGIDTWINMAGINTSNDNAIMSKADTGTDGYHFYYSQSGELIFEFEDASSNLVTIKKAIKGFETNTWYHVSINRSGNDFYLFFDGHLVATETSTYSVVSNSYNFRIGYQSGTFVRKLNGSLDEFRLSIGTSRYTGTIDYSEPTEAYTLPSECALGLDDYVKLYCNFNGTDGSTTLLDDYSDKTLVANGSAQLDTAQKKFGVSSLLLDSSTSDFVSISDSPDFDLSDVDFTFDFWVRFVSLPSSGNRMCLFSSWQDTTDEGYILNVYNNSGTYELEFTYTTDGSTGIACNFPISIVVDTFYHIAVCRDSTQLGLFIDGENIGCYEIGTDTIYNSSEDFKIGAYNTTETAFLDGYVDEFRFSKGISRYNLLSYTPSTTEFTADGNSPLILHMDGSDTSTNFIDNGDLIVTPKIDDAMGYFDGSGDYLTAPDSSDWDFGSGDFTIDLWVYPSAVSGTYGLVTHRTAFNSNHAWGLFINVNNVFFSYSTDGVTTNDITFSGAGLSANVWTHIAIVRNGTDLICYVNGVQYGSTHNISTATLYNSTQLLHVGCGNPSGVFPYAGYMDELRISKGVARWTTGFTPSTTAYSSDANTQLLLHFEGVHNSTTFTDSGNTGHTLTPNGNARISIGTKIIVANGNAQISTTDPKIGTGSALFDNANDSISIPYYSSLDLDGTDFTIEAWIKLASTTLTQVNSIIETINTSPGSNGYQFGLGTDRTIDFGTFNSGSTYFAQSFFDIEDTNWHHVAAVRKGTEIYLYIDGYLSDKALSTLFTDSGAVIYIGNEWGNRNTHDFNGNIDELRISTTDRYTPASFTVPTSEYAVCTGDTTPPSISTLSPVPDSTDVDVNTNLVIEFDENVTAVTGNNITIKRYNDDITIETIDAEDAKVSVTGVTATINPATTLDESTKYYVLIDSGAFEDLYNNAFTGFADKETWSFTTERLTPEILSLTPADNSTGNAIDTDLTIVYDRSVTTVSDKTLSIYEYNTSVLFEEFASNSSAITISGQTVTINPTSDFEKNKDYYVTIDSSFFESALGDGTDAITNKDTWNFKTIAITAPTIYQTTATLLILDYQGTVSAEAGTSETSVVITSHSLSEDDFIVNTTQNNTSRRILSATTDTITVNTVFNQTENDIIRTYAFTDHTCLLASGSLNVAKKIEEETQVSFTLICDPSYVPRAGQYIKININSIEAYVGVLRSATRRLPMNAVDTKIFVDCECASLKVIPPRRTIIAEYDLGTTASDIVATLINGFLVDEGITSGTIEQGVVLNEDWYDDSLSVGDILDGLAEQSGFQWFIDKDFNLQFYQDPTTISEYSATISDATTSTFTDFRNVVLSESIDDYNNKAFYVGNTDDYGNLIVVSQETTASILETQEVCAGSGVYGTVVRDSNLTQHEFFTAEAGTSETYIVATGIGAVVDVGDVIYNTETNRRENVISVSTDSIELANAISGQTVGDEIATYQEINDIVDNHLKKQDLIPRRLEFDSFTTDFEPAQKLQVYLSKLSVTTTESYVISEVNIQDRGAGYFVAHVVADKRNESNFSTQKKPDYKNYFSNL